MAQLLAGVAGGFLGGFLATALRVPLPWAEWTVLGCILLIFVVFGWVLGRWEGGPTRQDLALGCLLYVVVNVALDLIETGGDRFLLRVVLGGVCAALLYGAGLLGHSRRTGEVAARQPR